MAFLALLPILLCACSTKEEQTLDTPSSSVIGSQSEEGPTYIQPIEVSDTWKTVDTEGSHFELTDPIQRASLALMFRESIPHLEGVDTPYRSLGSFESAIAMEDTFREYIQDIIAFYPEYVTWETEQRDDGWTGILRADGGLPALYLEANMNGYQEVGVKYLSEYLMEETEIASEYIQSHLGTNISARDLMVLSTYCVANATESGCMVQVEDHDSWDAINVHLGWDNMWSISATRLVSLWE